MMDEQVFESLKRGMKQAVEYENKQLYVLIRECLEDTFHTHKEIELLDPDMPDGALLLHLGEMTAAEIRAARAAIR